MTATITVTAGTEPDKETRVTTLAGVTVVGYVVLDATEAAEFTVYGDRRIVIYEHTKGTLE